MDLRGENRSALDPRQHYFDKLTLICELKLLERENILYRIASLGKCLYEILFVNIWTTTMSPSFLMAVILYVWKCHKMVLSLYTLTLNKILSNCQGEDTIKSYAHWRRYFFG